MDNTKQKVKQCSHCFKEVDYRASRCPHCSGKIYVWTFVRKLVAGLVVVLVVVGIGSAIGGSDSSAPTPSAPSPVVAKAFDVPSLVGKNMDEIRTVLGTPDWDVEPTPLQIELGTKEWSKNYERKGATLSITYEIATGKVIDLFVDKYSENTDDILTTGGLSRSDNRYSLEFVKALNASGYTGVIVRAK